MLRLSKLADYAVVVMVRLSQADGCQTSPGVAAMTGLPEPTVAKVLKGLAGAGLVQSQRGARGGYRLARRLADVPIADVVAAIDGPIALATCVDGAGCDSEALCPVRGRWDPVNQAVLQALTRITLADMAPPSFSARRGGAGAVAAVGSSVSGSAVSGFSDSGSAGPGSPVSGSAVSGSSVSRSAGSGFAGSGSAGSGSTAPVSVSAPAIPAE